MNTSHITCQLFDIETLVGSNYKKWKNDVKIAFGLMDLNMVLMIDVEPSEPTTMGIAVKKLSYEK